MARPRFDDFYLFSSAKHFNQFENWTRSIRTPTSLKVVNDFSSANFGQRRQKINHSYIGNNPVQSTTTGSRTATPGSKRPISVIFLTPEKEGRRGSLANVKALSAAERAKIEGKDSIILNLSGDERFLIDFYSIYELNDSIIYAEIQ